MGTWSLESAAGELVLGDVSVKVDAIPGATLPPATPIISRPALGNGGIYDRSLVAPRLITLDLSSRRRGARDSALRSSLQLYCRSELAPTSLQYVGSQYTVSLTCYYLDGLEDLSPRFVVPDSRWLSGDSIDITPSGSSHTFTPSGTAYSYPSLSFSGSGSVSSVVRVSPEPQRTISLSVTLSAQSLDVNIGARTVLRDGSAALSILQPGSTFSSFALLCGISNRIDVTKAVGVIWSINYTPAFWSWEDADV